MCGGGMSGWKPYQPSSVLLPDGMRVKAPTRDISGVRFGRLVALRVVGKDKANSLVWLCRCDCGATVERPSSRLREGRGVSSCGCYIKEIRRQYLAEREPWNKGKSYSTKAESHEYSSKMAWAEAVIRAKGNRCEVCGWGEARCDVHHVTRRSDGGRNVVSNGRVLCPNCHRVEHEKHKKKDVAQPPPKQKRQAA